jgi:glycosyltransferase involved in cell wall biosynthesis
MEGDSFSRRVHPRVSQMKKILVFSLAYFPKHIGGAEIAIKEITDRIDSSDIEFHLITQRFQESLPLYDKIGNVHIHRVGNGASYIAKILFVPRAAIAGLRMHREHRFNAGWAMMSYMVFPLMLMRLFGAQIPYVLTLQEGDPFEHVFRRWHIRILAPLLRKGFREAKVVQTISTFLAEWARRAGFHGPLFVVPNGVDVQHFAEEHPLSAINEIKDSLGKRMGDVFLITTSRLVHKNAVDDVIRALAKLPTNVRFLVLGTGADELMLKTLAKKTGVSERVEFLGHVSHVDMPKYLKASDIFIRPSRSEGMGNSFVEAMAAGLPIIATQEGGLSDFLFDAKRNSDQPVTGWAVDTDSPDQIAAAVEDIMAQPEKVRAVVATARQMVIERFDWSLVARDMREKVFGQVLGISPVAKLDEEV